MRKGRSILASQPMKNLDWQLDFDAARHIKKRSCRNQRLMQSSELGRPKLCWLRHEMFAEQVGVLNHCPLERLENDAALFQLIGNHIALKELVTSEDHAPGYRFEAPRLLQNDCALFLG